MKENWTNKTILQKLEDLKKPILRMYTCKLCKKRGSKLVMKSKKFLTGKTNMICRYGCD